MTFSLNGGFVDQSAINTSLAGIEALAGVTLTTIGTLLIYDLGTLNLRVDGTLTINGTSDANKEMLVAGSGTNVDVHVRSGGTLNVGARYFQAGGDEYSQERFWPCIYEKENEGFSGSSAKATSGQAILGPSGGKGFLTVDAGGTLNWYGCINCTGGIGFDGLGNNDSTPVPTSNSTINIKDGVLDARRVATRSAVGDNFLYQYSGGVNVDGFTVINSDAADIGYSIILIEPPLSFIGFEPVMADSAQLGSTTVPRDIVITIENYGGNFGDPANLDGQFTVQQTAENSGRINFVDSVRGSLLNLSPSGGISQTFQVDQVNARQTVRAKAFTPAGTPIVDAVLATQNKGRLVSQSSSAAEAAQGILTMPDQPINNAVMTVGSKEYTFQTTLTNVDGNIEIGVNLAATQTNIENAINLTGTPGTGYAASMTINPDITASAFVSDDMVLTAKVAGAAGNDLDLFHGFYIPSGTGGTGSLNNLFNFNKCGVFIGGSALSEYHLGRLLLTSFVRDGTGPANSHPLPRHNNPSSQNDDLWSFYLYTYGSVDRSRVDVLMRTIGGQDIEFIVSPDLNITADRITADAYTDVRDMNRLYDIGKSFKINNVDIPVVESPFIAASGSVLDFGEFNIRIDGDSGGPLVVSQAPADRDQIAQGLAWSESTVAAIGAGSDRYLVVAVGNDNDPVRNVTSVTYGGIAMTRIGRRSGPTTRGSTSEVGIEVWGMGEDDIAAAADTNIIVTWDTTPTNNKVYRASFTGVSQIAARMGIDSDYSADTSPSAETALQTNPEAQDNGVVLCFAANQSAGAVTFEGALTERLDTTTSGFGFAVADVFPTADGPQSADVTSTENVVLSISLRPRQGSMTIFTSQDPVVTLIGSTEAVSVGVDDEITIDFPAGIEDGDVAYIAVGHAQSSANTWNTPAGWVIPTGLTEVQTGAATSRPGVSVFRRVLSSDSGSVNITNAGVNTSGVVAQMLVYRGVDNTTPEDVNATTASNTTGDPDPASITPVNDNSMILTFGFMDDGQQNSPTQPAGYTAILDTQTPDGAGSGE